jgi:uncharacterized repeat protein (TIGR01451 family)
MDTKNLSIVVAVAALIVAALGLRASAEPGPTDLALTMAGSAESVATGSSLVYTLSVRNTGDNDASGVVLTGTLPPNVAYVTATSSVRACSQADGTVTCDLGRVEAGASVTATIAVTAGRKGTATATAAVASPDETNDADNAETATTQIGR